MNCCWHSTLVSSNLPCQIAQEGIIGLICRTPGGYLAAGAQASPRSEFISPQNIVAGQHPERRVWATPEHWQDV